MGYRGEDLDLRTQISSGPGGKDLASDQENVAGPWGFSRNGPMWVDNTVLACANHAFDVALAHRAGEVRLEHFLHAMTRIEAAAEALEARGVRVAALRRESATIIASEIPVGLGSGKGSPRRSDEFAEVLRMASNAGARRNAPASIDDVLSVLFDPRTDMPALSLLARHTIRQSVRDTFEQFPPLSRYPGERYMPPLSERYARVQPELMRYVSDPLPRSMYRAEYVGSATDAVQNSRIEALEQLVRSLGDDLANERHLVSEMLKDLSRDTRAHRDDQGRMHTGLFERIQTLEQAISEQRGGSGVGVDGLVDQLLNLEVTLEQRVKEFGQGWSALLGRINDLEAVLKQTGGDSTVAGQLDQMVNRLQAIEEGVATRDGQGGGNAADRIERMEAIVSALDKQREAFGTAPEAQKKLLDEISERLSAVERALAAEIETSASKHSAYAQDLGEVHDALLKLNQNQHTLAGSIDQWRSDSVSEISAISGKLASLDRDNAEPMALLRSLTSQMDHLDRVVVQRHHRRHRFWYWLFGTDDWLGASWPSQTAAIEADRPQPQADEAAT